MGKDLSSWTGMVHRGSTLTLLNNKGIFVVFEKNNQASSCSLMECSRVPYSHENAKPDTVDAVLIYKKEIYSL